MPNHPKHSLYHTGVTASRGLLSYEDCGVMGWRMRKEKGEEREHAVVVQLRPARVKCEKVSGIMQTSTRRQT